MVMGDDSCLKGHGFKSQHIILDEHYFASICCKNWIVCLKRLKINEKEARVGPFFKIKFRINLCSAELEAISMVDFENYHHLTLQRQSVCFVFGVNVR